MSISRAPAVRRAKREVCSQVAEWARGQSESSGGATQTAWTELGEEMARRSGTHREHPRHPDQTEIDYETGDDGDG